MFHIEIKNNISQFIHDLLQKKKNTRMVEYYSKSLLMNTFLFERILRPLRLICAVNRPPYSEQLLTLNTISGLFSNENPYIVNISATKYTRVYEARENKREHSVHSETMLGDSSAIYPIPENSSHIRNEMGSKNGHCTMK